VYVKRRDASDGSYVFTRPTTGATTWTCFGFTGGDIYTPNQFANRAATGQSTISKGASVTPTVDNALVLGIALEATTAAEATEPTVSSNFAYWGGIAQVGSATDQLNTIRTYYQQQTTKQASGDMVVTYPNTQASNGAGVLFYIAPVPDAQAATAYKLTTANEGVVEGYLSYTEDGTTRIQVGNVWSMPFGRKIDRLFDKPFVMAHRGGSLDYAEMSMRGYTESVALGATGLEFSVARSSDGVFFGLHDADLNRTTPSLGATSFKPGEHTWAEISQLNVVVGNGDARFGPQPYMRLEDMLNTYARSHTIFIDPKVVGNANIGPLIEYLQTFPDYQNTFVGKYFHSGFVEVGRKFRAAGMKTWGYYYADDLNTSYVAAGGTKKATSIVETNGEWDYLGMEWNASQAAWNEILGYGKPVIGHIVPNLSAAQTAFGKGAVGVMASGIRSVMSGYVS
jgi:glycerophosphoryl diester phosphodiesterase